MTLLVAKKLACSGLIGKTVVKALLGTLSGPTAWSMLRVDIAVTVDGAITGGATVFIKKTMEIGLNQAIKN